MASGELLGFAAGILTTCSFLPQLMRVLRLKSAHEISILFTISLFAGVALWLAYGICLGLPSVILWNAVTLVLVGTLIFSKLKYGR